LPALSSRRHKAEQKILKCSKLLLSELSAFVSFEVFFYEFGLLRLYVGIDVCEINQPVGVPDHLEFFCCSSWFVFCQLCLASGKSLFAARRPLNIFFGLTALLYLLTVRGFWLCPIFSRSLFRLQCGPLSLMPEGGSFFRRLSLLV